MTVLKHVNTDRFHHLCDYICRGSQSAGEGVEKRLLASGRKQPPTRLFMDVLIITTKSMVEGQWMLEDLENKE